MVMPDCNKSFNSLYFLVKLDGSKNFSSTLVTQFGAGRIFREPHQCRGAHYISGTLYVNRKLCGAPNSLFCR